MTYFIKFTFGIINTSQINRIIHNNNKYYLYIMNGNMNKIKDSSIYSMKKYRFTICKNKNFTDYNIVKYWINSI